MLRLLAQQRMTLSAPEMLEWAFDASRAISAVAELLVVVAFSLPSMYQVSPFLLAKLISLLMSE